MEELYLNIDLTKLKKSIKEINKNKKSKNQKIAMSDPIRGLDGDLRKKVLAGLAGHRSGKLTAEEQNEIYVIQCEYDARNKPEEVKNETIEWKTWEEQGELKQEIKYWIDTGNNRQNIVNTISRENPDKWTKKEIHRAITELKKDLLISHCGHNYFKVTEWAYDAVCKATRCSDFHKALHRLRKARVYHREMENYKDLKTKY